MNLEEAYCPQLIDDVLGQDLSAVKAWLDDPDSRCWLFDGPPGTGKTSTAWCIIHMLDVHEQFGVHYLECGDLAKEKLEGVLSGARCRPLQGRWTVIFLEEVERLHPTIQILLKTRLDRSNLPNHVIVLACSNDVSKIDRAVRERFHRVRFRSDRTFKEACLHRLVQIWQERYPNDPIPHSAVNWGFDQDDGFIGSGTDVVNSEKLFSMRMALRDMGTHGARLKYQTKKAQVIQMPVESNVAAPTGDEIPF